MLSTAQMATLLWRVVPGEVRAEEAFSGNTSTRSHGRWHAAGCRVVYCSLSRGTALLEALVELRHKTRTATIVGAEVPDDVKLQRLDAASLPPHWRDNPPPKELRDLGTACRARGASAVLLVPSVIVPDELNAIVAPDHPDAPRIRLLAPHSFDMDKRLLERITVRT